jgi:hypothetical protein
VLPGFDSQRAVEKRFRGAVLDPRMAEHPKLDVELEIHGGRLDMD